MTDGPLPLLGAQALVDAMKEGRESAVAVMQACLDRIAALEPTVKAWAHLDATGALAAAERADAKRAAGEPLGPLHGLPVGIKDIIDTADMPTTFGTRVHAGRRPVADATLVTRLRAAGAIPVGKTVTSEYALFVPGPTRNPHDPSRTPGGSSSGSAAAVATGMVPVALATQTNGSTIRPASFCGIVGFKPSLGILPRTGILRQAAMLDHPGLMGRGVADVGLLADVLSGRDEADEPSLEAPFHLAQAAASARGAVPRLGLVRGPYWSRADAGTREAIMAFVARCGVSVDDIALPPAFSNAADILALIMEAGIAEAFHADAETSGDLMPEIVRRTIDRGRSRSAVELLAALTARDELRRAFDRIAAPYDALITPAAIGIAPHLGEGTGDPIFATTWTLLGVPAISLPLLSGPGAMPLGLQLVAGARRDAGLLRAAASLMQPRT